jgi:hypothetical protein
MKQETLEEAIKREYETRKFNSDFPFDPQSFKLGAKWQQEQDKNKYSEEDLKEAFKLFPRLINDPYNPMEDDNKEYRDIWIKGAKWQAEQSQEAINKLISIIEWYDNESDVRPDAETFMWLEQFKKK